MTEVLEQILNVPDTPVEDLKVPETKTEQVIEDTPQEEIEPTNEPEEVEEADDDSDLLEYEETKKPKKPTKLKSSQTI